MPYYGSINIDTQDRYNQQDLERIQNVQTVEFKYKNSHQNETQKLNDLKIGEVAIILNPDESN